MKNVAWKLVQYQQGIIHKKESNEVSNFDSFGIIYLL